jgi:hypothetical protein
MALADEHVAVMRAMLAGDFDEYDRLSRQLDETDGWGEDYPFLLGAAFFEAVDRRFSKSTPMAEVVRFVASARERFDQSSKDIDPTLAERLISSVFTLESLEDVDDRAIGLTQTVLIGELITIHEPDDAALDEFMAEARKIADRWAAEA